MREQIARPIGPPLPQKIAIFVLIATTDDRAAVSLESEAISFWPKIPVADTMKSSTPLA